MLRIKNLFILFVLLFTMSSAMTAFADEHCKMGQIPDDVCNASIYGYDAAIAAGMDETAAQATKAAAVANVNAGQSVADAVSAALTANGASEEVARAAANAITSGTSVALAIAALSSEQSLIRTNLIRGGVSGGSTSTSPN